MTVVLTHLPPTRVHRSSFALRTFISAGAHDTSSEPHQLETRAITDSRLLPPLPAELHLEIIDIITRRLSRTPCREEPYDPADLHTLFVCSLVCKLWLNTARNGIWAGVHLSGGKKTTAFVRLLRAYAREPKDAPSTRSLPSFGHNVSHLSLRETRGNAWDPKWLDDALPHLAAHLPRVQSLEMEQVTWEYLSSRSRTACLQAFKHLKNLALRAFVFHTTRDLYSFLGEFTKLEVLTLDGVHCTKKKNTSKWPFDSVVDLEGNTELPPRKLKEVGFRNVPMEAVLEWMMAGAEHQHKMGLARPRIQSIRVGGVGVSEANVVGRFLRNVGDSLRKVYIGFDTDFMESGDALVREMELAQNTNLEECHIFGLVVPSPPPVDPFEGPITPLLALEALTLLLSRIQSQMRVLSLALYPADLRAMSSIDFEGLTEVFERCAWSHLDEVRVVISNKGEPRLGAVVKERLRALNERGVLKVNVGFDEREVL